MTVRHSLTCWLLAIVPLSSVAANQPPSFSDAEVNAIYADVEKTYEDLHRNPELSLQEGQTARKMADGLRALGFEVTSGVGGTGVVGILRNGPGPVVLVRTELDALPVEENTGLSYASHVRTKNASGLDVGVMHACGHDIHMSTWLGTAKLMSANKPRWNGTLMMIGQPAEEIVAGAKAMIADGLYTKFPKPTYAIAIHDTNELPAGAVGYVVGAATSNTNAVELTVYGKGGHGAYPQTTVDPIVIAARIVLTLQTLVSRENSPWDPAIITVGSIHGGTKGNIIPDEVKLQITVRNYNDQVRKRLLAGIARIANAEAEAASAPKMPKMEITEAADAVYNDPEVTKKLVFALRARMGDENVHEERPITASEDFSEFKSGGVPTVMLSVGAANPAEFAQAVKEGRSLPSPHSALFAPDRERTLKGSIVTETTMVLALMGK